MKVVLDTNIIISGIIYPDSIPQKILGLAMGDVFELRISDFIIDETENKLVTKFKFSSETAVKEINNLIRLSSIIEPKQKISIIKNNESDNRILECAIAAKADYLVTGDKKHILPLEKINKTKIISAREFLRILDKEI